MNYCAVSANRLAIETGTSSMVLNFLRPGGLGGVVPPRWGRRLRMMLLRLISN